MNSPPSNEITLREAADVLDVHYMTVYRYVRLGYIPARKISNQWWIDIGDLDAFRSGERVAPGRHEAPWSERLEARLVAGDVAGAWAVVEAALASGHDPRSIYVEVLAPALTTIGDKWESGELGVEDEHLATAVAARLIGRLGPRFARPGRPKGTVVLAAPAGDPHALGPAMLADVVRGLGFSVLDLGANTPPSILAAALERIDDVRAVCISIAIDEALATAAEMVAAARAVTGSSVPVFVGGAAIESDGDVVDIQADAWGRSIDDIAGLLDGEGTRESA